MGGEPLPVAPPVGPAAEPAVSVRRVLLVTTSFAPEVGGVETHLVELVGELQRRGVEVAVLRQDELPLGRARDDHGALAEPRGVRVHRARRRAFWRAMRQLTDPRGPEVPDVVHVHDYSRPLLLQAVGSCRGRPLVFTPHGGLLSPPERARRGDRLVMAAFDRFVAARILGRVRCVVALTEEQRQAICDGYGVAPERVVVLPNMVPSDARVVGAASRGSSGRFLAVARLAAQKRLGDLVAAVEAHPDLPGCDIAGPDGDQAAEVREAVRRSAPGRVRLLGPVVGRERLDLMRQALALVLPSAWEGQSITALEAIAQGTPVIASESGSHGLPASAVLTYPTGDVEALAERMKEACDASGREALRRGVDEASGLLPSVGTHVDALLSLYRSVLEEPGT